MTAGELAARLAELPPDTMVWINDYDGALHELRAVSTVEPIPKPGHPLASAFGPHEVSAASGHVELGWTR